MDKGLSHHFAGTLTCLITRPAVLGKNNIPTHAVKCRTQDQLERKSLPEFRDIKEAQLAAELQKHKAYSHIAEWFEGWQPWQKRLLLNGITRRLVN